MMDRMLAVKVIESLCNAISHLSVAMDEARRPGYGELFEDLTDHAESLTELMQSILKDLKTPARPPEPQGGE